MASKLDSGNPFPSITLQLAGGGEITLPDQLATAYGVILFYRGFW